MINMTQRNQAGVSEFSFLRGDNEDSDTGCFKTK
jgi:hypothetical protein